MSGGGTISPSLPPDSPARVILRCVKPIVCLFQSAARFAPTYTHQSGTPCRRGREWNGQPRQHASLGSLSVSLGGGCKRVGFHARFEVPLLLPARPGKPACEPFKRTQREKSFLPILQPVGAMASCSTSCAGQPQFATGADAAKVPVPGWPHGPSRGRRHTHR